MALFARRCSARLSATPQVPLTVTRNLATGRTRDNFSSWGKRLSVGGAAAVLLGGAASVNVWMDESPMSQLMSSEKSEAIFLYNDRTRYEDFPKQRLFADSSKKYPLIPLEEVKKDHGSDVWVTLDGGVYNVTPFLEAHPGGGERIMMVDKADLAAFWKVYNLHQRPHIRKLLEEYRIGTLSPEDAATIEKETEFANYYDSDPVRPRKAELRIPSERPWNSEPQPEVLTDTFFTPNDQFFVRNHNSVPDIDEEEYELEIDANPKIGMESRKFTLSDLKTKFPRVEVIAALQCAGNRQEEYVTTDRPLYVAPHWRNGAIGNAKWAGVRVRDLLKACGMDIDQMALGNKSTEGMKICNFIGEDTDETGIPYGGVIPIEKVIDPFGDAILAYEMNGETLSRDHGFPVRLLAPGHAGCRNVKWVKTINITETPSDLDSGSKLDRHFAPDISWDEHRQHVDHVGVGYKSECKVRVDQGPVIQTLPVQSVISVPRNKQVLSGQKDTVTVKGIAWSGAGRGICRVEVSNDGGETFTGAEIKCNPDDPFSKCSGNELPPRPEQGQGRNWAWSQYEEEIPIPKHLIEKLNQGESVEMSIVAKAIDGDFNSQPEKMTTTWNVLGICVNHWPRVTVTLDPKIEPTNEPPPPEQPSAGSCVWPCDCMCEDKPGQNPKFINLTNY